MCGDAHASVAPPDILESIFISGFRNLAVQEVQFSPRLNLLLGRNGQGKTNLLEAVFFLSLLRPLRARSLAEMVRWGQQQALARGRLSKSGLPSVIEVRLEQGKKAVFLDGKERQALEVAGHLKAVIFSPDDLDLIKGTPEVRRRFLDRAAFVRERGHLKNLLFFRKALRSRNSLLGSSGHDGLEAFSRQLAHYGAMVTAARGRIAAQLADVAAAKSSGEIELRFRPGWPFTHGEAEEKLLETMASALTQDRQNGFTRFGPQRDDLEILYRSRPAATFASQGQKRSCSIKVMLSLVEMLSRTGSPPLLLLDDISSELDAENRRSILRQVQDTGGQAFITATEFEEESHIAADSFIFDVESGAVKRR